MKGILINEPGNYEIKELEIPKLTSPGDVLVKVEGCGLCGTDIHLYKGLGFAKYPVIPGHEFIGKIVKMGQAAQEYFKLEERVAIDPNLPCFVCEECRKGRYNLCSNMTNIGVNKNGGFAEYTIVNYKQLYKVPEELDLKIVVLAEPVSCIIHSIEKVNPLPNNKILIIGAGPIGLMTAKILENVYGIKNIFIQEIDDNRIDNSKKFGIKNIAKNYLDNFDIVFEMSGSIQGFEESLKRLNPGGKIVQFGVAKENSFAKVNQYDIYNKELTILGSFVNPFTMSKAIDILNTYSSIFSGIVDKNVNFEQLADIFIGNISPNSFTKAILCF